MISFKASSEGMAAPWAGRCQTASRDEGWQRRSTTESSSGMLTVVSSCRVLMGDILLFFLLYTPCRLPATAFAGRTGQTLRSGPENSR